jgi:hypothetical protein
MSWHHIIPFSVLRGVWNRLVDQQIATQLAEARVAIRQYILLCDRRKPDVDALVDRMRAENTTQRRAGHAPPLPELDGGEALELMTDAVWPPWNAVEGPNRRSDDPGDHYLDRFNSGLTAEESARMITIELLFYQFQAFINAGDAPGAGSLQALAQAVSAARSAIWCDEPIHYRAQMWIQDSNGFWRKQRNGEPYIPPID